MSHGLGIGQVYLRTYHIDFDAFSWRFKSWQFLDESRNPTRLAVMVGLPIFYQWAFYSVLERSNGLYFAVIVQLDSLIFRKDMLRYQWCMLDMFSLNNWIDIILLTYISISLPQNRLRLYSNGSKAVFSKVLLQYTVINSK